MSSPPPVDLGPLADAPLWPVHVGGAVIALTLGALLVVTLERAARLLGSGPGAWLRERRPLLGILAAATLVRLLIAPTTELWYAPIAGRSFASLVPGVTGLLLLASRVVPAVAPFSLLVLVVTVAGLGCVWHAHRLCTELGLPASTAAVVGLGFALWPSFVRISTTDGSHVVALCFWLIAARAWRGDAPLRLGPTLLAGACLFSLPFLHRETVAWPLAALCLRPPRRLSAPPTWVVAGVLAVGPYLAARAFCATPPFFSEEGPSWAAFPLAPLSIAWGMSLTAAGALAILALEVVGAPGLFRSQRALCLRLVAMCFALFLPMLLGAHRAEDTLSFRYYLPCELAAFVGVASGLARLRALPGLPARIGLAVVGAGVLLAEGWRGLSDAGQDVYQGELTFLRQQAPRLAPGATLCMLAPEIDHAFPGRDHLDLAASYSPGPLGAWYLGRPDVSVTAWETEDLGSMAACDYYYESSICHLTTRPQEPDSLRADVRRIQDLCARLRAELALEPFAAGQASGRSHKGRVFDAHPVPLVLSRVKRPSPAGAP